MERNGFLVIVLPLLFATAGQTIVNYIGGEGTYTENQSVVFGISVFLSAITLFFVGQKRNKDKDKSDFGDKLINSRDSLFFIDMRAWSILVFILGLIGFIA